MILQMPKYNFEIYRIFICTDSFAYCIEYWHKYYFNMYSNLKKRKFEFLQKLFIVLKHYFTYYQSKKYK